VSALAALAGCSDSALKSDEQVTFYPVLAVSRGPAGWELEVHGHVREPERRPVLTAVLRRAVGIDEDELSADERRIWRERAHLFLEDNERGKQLALRVASQEFTLPASAANGHFHASLALSAAPSGGVPGLTNGLLAAAVRGGRGDWRPVSLEAHFLAAAGLSVISDIDDTIKVSQVLDRRELLRNTFCRPFKPVPGMAAAYVRWRELAGAQFHYVSASPWQLYEPLAAFVRSNGFPVGTFHLKNFRVKDETFFDLFQAPEEYKLGVIAPLLERFPARRFVLVGDSGERDPEIYATLARRFPQQVQRIFIRDVTGEAADSPRYQTTFAGLPPGLWTIFTDPKEIETALTAQRSP
jgi:hypothetical protein